MGLAVGAGSEARSGAEGAGVRLITGEAPALKSTTIFCGRAFIFALAAAGGSGRARPLAASARTTLAGGLLAAAAGGLADFGAADPRVPEASLSLISSLMESSGVEEDEEGEGGATSAAAAVDASAGAMRNSWSRSLSYESLTSNDELDEESFWFAPLTSRCELR